LELHILSQDLFRHRQLCSWVCIVQLDRILNSGVTRNFFSGGGVQQIQLRTQGRQNGDLGAVAPKSGVLLNLQMSETRILIKLLQVYFPWNWEFSPALSKLQNFGGGGGEFESSALGTPLILKNGLCYLTLQNTVPPCTLKLYFTYSFDDLVLFFYGLIRSW
jgi:hypothetical protein